MKAFIKISSFFAICILFTLLSFTSHKDKIIVIDAGHGGKDFGTTHGDLREKDIVRQVATEIANQSKELNVQIYIIGEEDVFIDLGERAKAINSLNPDVLISLHLNSSMNSNNKGASAIISPQNKHFETSKKIASKILKSLDNNSEVIEQNLFVLKNVNCPAINLQLGYLSNYDDRNLLNSIEGQKSIGQKIYNVLLDL